MSDKLLGEWFWTDRWMGSSAFLLPLEARGLYREMLTQAWRRGARLPNDLDAIKRAVAVTDEEWAKNWPLVERYWRVRKGFLVNPTQAQIYTATKAISEARSRAGRRGGQVTQALKAQAKVQAKEQATAAAKLKPPSPSPREEEKQKTVSLRPPKEPADGRVKEFLTWFQAEYRTRRHGADYLVKWDRDGPLVKQMLGATALPRLQKLAQILLSDKTDEPFIAETDRGVGILSVKFNWLSERLAAWEARQKAVSA